jgi:4-hydroxybenzoate polyprenyltransferase
MYVLAAIVAALMVTGAIIHNDAIDAELDAIEKPHRPIPSGRIKRKHAEIVGDSMMLLGIGLSVPLGFIPAVITSILWLLSIYYNTKAKKDHAFVGNLVVAICVGATLYFPMAIVGVWNLWPQAVGFILIEWARETYITCQDVYGDREAGYKTMPVMVGVFWSLLMCAILLIIGSIPMMITINHNLGWIYRITAISFILCLLIGVFLAWGLELQLVKISVIARMDEKGAVRDRITSVYELWGRKIAKNLLLLMIAAMFVDFVI